MIRIDCTVKIALFRILRDRISFLIGVSEDMSLSFDFSSRFHDTTSLFIGTTSILQNYVCNGTFEYFRIFPGLNSN